VSRLWPRFVPTKILLTTDFSNFSKVAILHAGGFRLGANGFIRGLGKPKVRAFLPIFGCLGKVGDAHRCQDYPDFGAGHPHP